MSDDMDMVEAPLWRQMLPVIAVAITDVFLIGVGMGVPLFAILFGFPVGWRIARRSRMTGLRCEETRKVVGWAAALAGVTCVMMLVVWGVSIPTAFAPSVDADKLGIPLILYTPRASIIAWLLLMIVVSPILQYMATVTAALTTVALARREEEKAQD